MALDPQWDRVLEQDSVALRCQGAAPQEDNSTWWFHNGKRLPNQTSSYVIAGARVADGGEYRCETNRSALSEAVRLEVHAGEQAAGPQAAPPALPSAPGSPSPLMGQVVSNSRSFWLI